MRHSPTTRAVLAVAVTAAAVVTALRGERPLAHVAVGGAAGGVAATNNPEPAPTDPFPIRRVWVPPGQVPVPTGDQPGAWRKLPRDEFERRVRAAADAQAVAAIPPLLVRAEYRAAYEPGRLFGSVEWTVVNPGRRPGAVPFDPLKMAVDDPKWAGGRNALLFHGQLARGDRPGTFLWVDGADGGTVAAGWSVRGVYAADAETFTLSAPAAAIARAEVTLPAGLRLACSTPGVVLSGPTGDHRWQVLFGGRAEVVLTVRKAVTNRPPPPVGRAARYEVAAGAIQAAFVFPHAPHADEREWVFDVDPGLVVDRVSGEGCGGWSAEPGGKLRVRLQPVSTAAKLTITATARLAPETAGYPLPGVRPAEGVAADLIDLSLPPDWKLDGWSAPDYRVSVPGEQADRTFRMQFAGGVVTTGDPARRRPVVRLRRPDAEYTTDEAVSWSVTPGTTRLTARVKVKVARGPLTALPVMTEPGYVLEKVAVVPDDPTVEFGRQPGVPGGWLVEPTRGIGGGQTAEFRLDFRADNRVRAGDPADSSPAPTGEPLPRFALPAAADRQGTLAVTAGGGLRAAVRTTGGGTETEVSYRGREPVGEVRLTPERVTAAVTGYHLSLDGREWVVGVTGRAGESGLSDLTVVLPHPAGVVRSDGAAATPLPAPALLPLLTANSGWAAVAAAGATAGVPGGYWRVSFDRPVRGEFALSVRLPAGREPTGPARVDVPLPRVCGVPDDAADVTLAPALAATYRGERESGTAPDPRSRFPSLSLTPRRVDAASPSREWRYEELHRTGTVHPDGSVGVVLTGRVVQAAAGVLTVRLPAAATLDGLTLGGRWVTPTPAGGGYQCPLPEIDAGGLPVELRYRLPAAGDAAPARHTAPAPELPGDPTPSHWWALADGLCSWPAAGAADAVWVFSASVPTALGLLFAGVSAASGWSARFGSRGRALLAGQVVVWAVASRVLPDGWAAAWQYPLTCGLLGLAAGVLARRTPPAGRSTGGGGTAASFAILAGVAGYGFARTQGSEPVTVYLTGDGDRLVVYAAQATLDRLDAEAAPPLAGGILTRARYTGSVVNDVARFEAAYTVHCPARGDQQVHLPLAGVRLERVTVDGTEVFPEVSRADRYTVAVPGPGRHELTVRFAVVPTDLRTGRTTRFGVPEVPCTRVSFTTGAAGERPDVVSRQGGQVVGTGGTVEADHGGGRSVEVRWRAVNPPASQPSVRVKEGAVWDVAADAPAVTAAFVYQIDGGPRDRFRWAIPAGLVPVSVLVRAGEERADPLGAEPWAVRPAPGGPAVVEVKLKTAVEGRVTAVLRLVPAAPLTAAPVLRFPAAADVPDADRESVYAVRFGGVTPAGMAIESAIDFPPDAVAKDFAGVGELNLDKAPPARVLKRTAGGQTELRPELRPHPGWAGVAAEATYTLGRWQTADGAFRVTGREVGAFEFDLPPAVELRDVRAADLKGWSRSGSRVQVWLARPTADLTVRWAGQFAAGDGRVELPLPQPSAAGGWASPLTVRVRPAAGWVVRPVSTPGLTARGAGGTAESVYTAERGATAVFQVQSVAPTPKPGEPPRRSPPPTPVDTPGRPATAPAADVGDERPPARWSGWPADVTWLAGVALVVGLYLRGNRRWAPECLAGIAALGLIDASPAAAILFAPPAVAGLGWRVTRWVRSRG